MITLKDVSKYAIIAEQLATFSTADRAKVGALLIKNGRIVSTGYNGQLPGEPHKALMFGGHDISTVHAEQNAICFAAKNGISTNDCEMIITHTPCSTCTKILLQAGINKVYIIHSYRESENPFLDKLDVEKISR